MNNDHKYTHRENFLLSIINKLIKEYKGLLALGKPPKPFKIIEIIQTSTIPGETLFVMQVTNKNCFLKLTAGDILKNYDLNNFTDFHAQMIQQAALGKLVEFLRLDDKNPVYKIISKKFDRKIKQYLFTIETKDQIRFIRTGTELSLDKNLLSNLETGDVYDIGFTQGSESILSESSLKNQNS